jgi:hypothetical protein
VSRAALFAQRGQGGLLVSGVFKMKRSLSLALEIIVKLGTCLAACIGCSSKNPPCPVAPEKPQPRVIHWKAADSGYEETTVQPTDAANSTGKK